MTKVWLIESTEFGKNSFERFAFVEKLNTVIDLENKLI